MPDKEAKEICLKLGQTIREIRVKQCISQEELAERAGMHRTFMSHVECATRNITVYNLVKLARALKIKPYILLKDLN